MTDTPPTTGTMQMSAARYHSDPCAVPSLSSTIANILISDSPAHARLAHPRLPGKAPKKETKSLTDGSHVHPRILGAGGETIEAVKVLNKKGVQVTTYQTKAAQELRDDIKSRGHVAMLPHEIERIDGICDGIEASLLTHGIDFQDESSEREHCFFWQEKAANGQLVQCRSMLDYWHPERWMIRDLKTARSANPRKLARHIGEYGYDLQAAAQMRAIGANHPDLVGRLMYQWVFCELVPPFAVTPAEPDQMMQTLGLGKWQRAVNLWAHCIETDTWPAYVTSPVSIAPTKWEYEEFFGDDYEED